MSRYGAALLVLTVLIAGATAPAQPPDNGPAREALREAVQHLDDAAPWQTALFLLHVAELYQKLGDAKEAANVMDLMREKLTAQRPKWRSGWYGDSILSKAYARLGDAKASIEESARVEDKNAQLRNSALEAAKAGHVQAAYQIAEALADANIKSEIKARIREDALIRRAQAGDAAEALQAADQLPTAMAKVSMLVGHDLAVVLMWDSRRMHYLDTDNFRDGIASLQYEAGNKAAAKETALKALALLPSVDEAQRARAALVVFWLLAEVDDLASARKALAIMPTESDPKKARVIELKAKGCIAAAEVRAGRDEAALALVRDFENPRQQAYILQIAALAQARAGRKDASKANFNRAVNLLTGDPKPGPGGTSMRNIAVAEALAGDFAAAVQHAKESGDFGLTLALVADLQAESRDFAGARKTAELVKKFQAAPMNACDAFRNVARKQAKAAQAEAVRAWAGQEPDGLRAYLLVGLAEGLLGAKKP